MMNDKKLKVSIGKIELKNPLICGSGEHFIEEVGILKAIRLGAAVVVAKSTNESDAARRQLDKTDYSLIDAELKVCEWQKSDNKGKSLFGRSGLIGTDSEDWLKQIAKYDKIAKEGNAYVAASLIPENLDYLCRYAELAEKLGIRILELNIGAPHGVEVTEGIQVTLEQERVKDIVSKVRQVYQGSLWVKVAGFSEDVSGLCLAAKEAGADAVVMIGRMMALMPDLDSMLPLLGTKGAYGGRWALPITCRWLSESREVAGEEYALIGTNGARDGYDIARMMLSGATAVELTSAIFLDGFNVISKSIEQLSGYLDEKGMVASELVGYAADRLESYDEQEIRPDYWREFVSDDALN